VTTSADTGADPRGKGLEYYDWYHYLWHLIAIGAVSAAPAEGARYTLAPAAWDMVPTENGALPGDGEIIAMIDIGANDRHPNLRPRILPAVDFAAHPFGCKYQPETPDPLDGPVPGDRAHVQAPMFRGLEERLDDSLVDQATWNWIRTRLPASRHDLLDSLAAGRGVRHPDVQVSREQFSAHGTACAGLMIGAPADPATTLQSGDEAGDGPLPYWGVAPGAEVIPITVSSEPTAEQLILAFLHARASGASVIHFPREAPDPQRAPRLRQGYGTGRYVVDPAAQAAWDCFAEVLEAVAEEVPVVCAGGNGGTDRLIYPANTADGTNGVIAVAAVTYKARRASYSDYDDGNGGAGGPTIAAPSDDAEILTRDQFRLNREAPRWREHNFWAQLRALEGLEVAYAPQALFTTDVPGPGGYAEGVLTGPSTQAREDLDRDGLYALFGGTSGASAIVAGAVALFQARQRAMTGGPGNGSAVKAKILTSGDQAVSWPWLDAIPTPVETDRANGEPAVPFARQFGAGVLSLQKLLS